MAETLFGTKISLLEDSSAIMSVSCNSVLMHHKAIISIQLIGT